MIISAANLSQNANAYVDHGVLRKWRGGTQLFPALCEVLRQKVTSKEKLTIVEVEFIKSLDRVIIESEGTVEFFNFTGAAMKFNK